MTKWICDDQEIVRRVGGPWAREKIGNAFPFRDYTGLMLCDGDKIIAVVLYTDFDYSGISMHIASDGSKRWLNRAFMRTAFDYPFNQLGVRRVTGLVAASNRAALKFDQHLGFRIEGRLRVASPDGSDLLVLGMLRQECRYLKERDNEFRQRQRAVCA